MAIKIEPLTEDRVKEAIAFIHKIFDSNPDDPDSSEKWFPASLHPEKYKKLYEGIGCTECKYFAAIDEDTGKIVGTTGYYTHNADQDEADWLGWFSVDPDYRRKGLGTRLLEFVKEKARKRGKKFLRLYTTDSPKEEPAQKFYDAAGLKIVKTAPTDKYKRAKIIIYREMKL